MSEREDLRPALLSLLQRTVPAFTSLDEVRALTAGASQQMYRITLTTASGEQRLALRRGHPGLAQDDTVGGITLATEAQLLTLAGTVDVPVPAVEHVLTPEDNLGEGFLMAWLEGETLGQRITHSPDLADCRQGLAHQCGEILGRIHSIDWQAAQLDQTLPTVSPEQLVDQTWQWYRDLNVPQPMIDYTWRWLRDHLPEQWTPSLVHGDFRNGNLMVGPDGVRAVLDWELAQIGDPLRDLGWLCVNSWRFGRTDLPVGGFGSVEDLLAGYTATSGHTVDPDALKFWQVFGSFWWSCATLHMASTWRSGETPSLERPVIGRRSSEAQMDCVNLLIPGPVELPCPVDAAAGTQLPMPAELLRGVVSFLAEDVAGELRGKDRFLARVGANSLGIVERELLYGAKLGEAEHARLSKLLGKDAPLDDLRRTLVEMLRAPGQLDSVALAEHLRASVAGQLFIDQPTYSALPANAANA